MKNELVPPIMESILNKRFKVYNLWLSGACDGKKKKIVWYGLEEMSQRNEICSQFKRNIKH